MGKTFVFGIDGASPELIFDKWLDFLPNIKRLMQTGSYAKLNSTIPPATIIAWNSMISGKDPSELGIFSYTYKDSEGNTRLINSENKKCKSIFDILDKKNKRSISLYVPLSYPVKPLEGCMISGFLTPHIDGECAYPVSLKDKIKELGNPDLFFDVAVGLAGHKGLELNELIEKTYEMTEMQIKLLKDLIVNEKWDFFMGVILGTDRLQHMIWRHFDETHRRFIKDSPHKNALKDYYIYLDKQLGEILKLLDGDTVVIVASDHGMTKQEGKININNWLIQEGYLVLKEGIDLTEKKRFDLDYVDLEKTSVWAGGAYNARIFINKKVVGDGCDELKEELIKKLKNIPDDEGNEINNLVYDSKKIYKDCSSPECPDLTVYFDNLSWSSNPDLGQEGLYSWQSAVGADSAGHSRQGCFIIGGKGIENKEDIGVIDIKQVAPTILQLLNVNIPEDITVKPIEIFKKNNIHQIKENCLFEKIESDYNKIKTRFQTEDPKLVAESIAEEISEHNKVLNEIFSFLVESFKDKWRNDKKTPLVFHSIFLTKILYDCGERDLNILLTAALHDVLEDTLINEEQLRKQSFFDNENSNQELIITNLKILKENIELSREPDGKTLPPRYKEHISRLIGSTKEIINVEIVDRFCDLMDLDYILELPEEEKIIRLASKIIKVKSFVENIIWGRNDYNESCLNLFNYKMEQIENNYGIKKEAILVEPTTESKEKEIEDNNYLPEATLIDTEEGIQCKVYATSHPPGKIIVKPKYIPKDLIDFLGLKKRFIFGKCMNRFNLFNSKEVVKENLKKLKLKYPYFIYWCDKHKNWFLTVPNGKIKKFHDPKEGVRQLMKIPLKDLDPYLNATRGIIELILESGINLENIGISHSTLLGNYTSGKSDIDIIVFGKDNGWKVIKYMEVAEHHLLKWKTEQDWSKYYQDRIVSKQFSQKEYVFNMVRKRDDGFFDGNVFSIFVVENEDETWYNWEAEHEPLATVKLRAVVSDATNSHIRPGYYEISDSQILWGYSNVPVKRIVTWSRPFVLQAKEQEKVEAVGLLEKIKTKNEEYYQVVLGYFDTYTTNRGEEEYLKALIN
ncbi:MAG: alkaline phosphatase family protein [Candidatus Hodarchaeota archaeon]